MERARRKEKRERAWGLGLTEWNKKAHLHVKGYGCHQVAKAPSVTVCEYVCVCDCVCVHVFHFEGDWTGSFSLLCKTAVKAEHSCSRGRCTSFLLFLNKTQD